MPLHYKPSSTKNQHTELRTFLQPSQHRSKACQLHRTRKQAEVASQQFLSLHPPPTPFYLRGHGLAHTCSWGQPCRSAGHRSASAQPKSRQHRKQTPAAPRTELSPPLLPCFNSPRPQSILHVHLAGTFARFLHKNKRALPIKSHFVTEFLLADVPVQEVVADVGLRPFHPLDEDLPLRHIEVVPEERPRVLLLPVELLGDVTPKLYKSNGHNLQPSEPRNGNRSGSQRGRRGAAKRPRQRPGLRQRLPRAALTLRLLHGAPVQPPVVRQRGDVRRRQQLGPRPVQPGLLLGLHHGGRRRL